MKPPGILMAIIAALLLVHWYLTPAAVQQQPPRGANWEYGIVTLGENEPTFWQAQQQTGATIAGYAAEPPASNSDISGVRLSMKPGKNLDVMFLNVLGSQGWETVSVVTDNRITRIFMKRAI